MHDSIHDICMYDHIISCSVISGGQFNTKFIYLLFVTFLDISVLKGRLAPLTCSNLTYALLAQSYLSHNKKLSVLLVLSLKYANGKIKR